jgi:hypothetical protein
MFIKLNNKLNASLSLILIITLIYSLMVGSGFYGFGNDYYTAYIYENLNWGGWQDRLGYRISTFTILGKNYGVYIVSSILAFCSGIFINLFLKKKKIYLTIFFIFIYILALHTWPIIMSTSNAMRQGITMSLVFLCFANLLNQKYLTAFILVTISSFTHKSGIIYFYVFLSLWILRLVLNNVKLTKNSQFFLIFFFGIFMLIFVFFFLTFFIPLETESRIIRGDFRYPFLLISLIFISCFIYKAKNLISNDLNLFMYLFSIVSIPFLLLGYNWQYERLMMMMTIPYLLILSTLFAKKYSYYLLFYSFSLLFLLTIHQNLYESLK